MKVGDVVKLKSGGPDMTINQITGDSVLCQWFKNGVDLERGSFVLDQLEAVSSHSWKSRKPVSGRVA